MQTQASPDTAPMPTTLDGALELLAQRDQRIAELEHELEETRLDLRFAEWDAADLELRAIKLSRALDDADDHALQMEMTLLRDDWEFEQLDQRLLEAHALIENLRRGPAATAQKDLTPDPSPRQGAGSM